jgi:hypothetical protein
MVHTLGVVTPSPSKAGSRPDRSVSVFDLAQLMGTSVAMFERHYGTLIEGPGSDIARRLSAFQAEEDRVTADDAEDVSATIGPGAPSSPWRSIWRKPPLAGESEAPRAGLEPATRGLEGRCSFQLSYRGG